MSNALHNRFLFSHLYLERLCQKAEEKRKAANLIADLQGWLPDWDDSSLSSLVGTHVEPTLVGLGFHYQQSEDPPSLIHLYSTYRREKPIGLCHVAHLQGETDGLDSTVKGRHYAAEIIHALREEGLNWGLLTDGRCWRLYHADELAPYETYLEIDLAQVLQDGGSAVNEDAALLLHTLFREPAFAPDEEGECALDHHLCASEEATLGIEEHLSDCIEDVLRYLCQGFIERDGQESYTEEQRDEVFFNATVLLYRMLFILYAEARELLPLSDPQYDPVSLDALVERAADYTKVSGLPSPDGTGLWQDLLDLCSWINSGDKERHIPCYNGDLFEDSDKRYIHDQTITDKYLTRVLFSLGCIEEDSPQDYRRIDYRDLSVRHLGSIYEGLLEYKLFIAQERRVRRSDGKGGFTFPKLSETKQKKGEEDNVINVGEVYFAQSAGERKAMGAYYTPEHIVDYIVKQTIRRGLEERRGELEEQLPGWLDEVRTAVPAEQARLQQYVDEKLVEFVEDEVLTFRACDPAMGSGHFLVNAAHTITNFIVETLNLTPWENPEVDSDPVVWRRRVAKHCLYGVDLNPLAVELAKLSLWLTTVAEGKPLSFLDHHLRPGNSLIGARLEDLAPLLQEPSRKEQEAQEVGQLSMFEEYPAFRRAVVEATDLLRQISKRVASAAEDVKAQAADYDQVRYELEPYRNLADLWVAGHFGVDTDKRQLNPSDKHLSNAMFGATLHQERLGIEAQALARHWRFFHWDLEFPIPMLTDDGFDVVIGNPPYDELSEDELERPIEERAFLEARPVYAAALHYRVNLYRLFILLAVDLVKANGLHSYIVPMSILGDRFALEVRKKIVFGTGLVLIESFPQKDDPSNRVFPDAKLSTCLYVLRKCGQEAKFRVRTHPGRRILGNSPAYWAEPEELCNIDEDNLPIPALDQHGLSLALRLGTDRSLRPLGEIAKAVPGEIMINRKIRPYLSDSPNEYELIRGAYVGRYLLQPPKQGKTLYLRKDKYLSKFGSSEKAERHEHARVIYQRYAPIDNYRRLIGTKLPAGHFCSHTVGYFVELGIGPLCLLALFNSKLLDWRYNVTSTNNSINGYEIEALPVPRFGIPCTEGERLGQQAQEISTTAVHTSDFAPVLSFLDSYLPPDGKHSSIIHDLLAHLAEQMIEMQKNRQELEGQVDLFRFVNYGLPFVRLDDALVLDENCRADEEMNLAALHHDIDGLRLMPNEDGTWTLELKAKFRDPEQGWRDWIIEEDGHLIKRRWVPAYRLALSEEKARFYRYALPRLQAFDNARSFPGGRTRSTLEKLHLTQVPIAPDVDLSELTRLDRELADARRKIELTDDLIDQIVYKLYGLTEDEIAIVEGQTKVR